MKVVCSLKDYKKALTPFYNGCAYKAYIEKSDIKIGYGCYGVHVNLCRDMEEYLMRKLGISGDPKISVMDLDNDFHIMELRKLIEEIPPCRVCGGTLSKKDERK